MKIIENSMTKDRSFYLIKARDTDVTYTFDRCVVCDLEGLNTSHGEIVAHSACWVKLSYAYQSYIIHLYEKLTKLPATGVGENRKSVTIADETDFNEGLG